MSFLTLITDEKHWLATDQLVFGPNEIATVNDVVDQLKVLGNARRELDGECELKLAEAREDGYEEGYAQGSASAQEHGLRVIQDLQLSFDKRVNEHHLAIMDLAIAVVKKIAGQVVNEDWLVAQALHAIKDLDANCTDIRLVVNESKLTEVKARVSALQSAGNIGAERIGETIGEVDVDEQFCELHTAFGSIAVDLERQLSTIVSVLEGVR